MQILYILSHSIKGENAGRHNNRCRGGEVPVPQPPGSPRSSAWQKVIMTTAELDMIALLLTHSGRSKVEGYVLLFHISQILVVSHKSDFGNQEIRQLDPWNLARWEILLIVSGKLLRRKFIGGLGAKIIQLITRHLCEITRGLPPLHLDAKINHFPIHHFQLS